MLIPFFGPLFRPVTYWFGPGREDRAAQAGEVQSRLYSDNRKWQRKSDKIR